MIQEPMGVRGGLCVIASFVLLLVLIAACLGSKKAAEEPSLASQVNLMERNQQDTVKDCYFFFN